LIKSIRLPASYHSAVIPVQVEDVKGSVLTESLDDCLQIDASFVTVNQDGLAALMVSNHGKSTYQLRSGVELASASEVEPEVDNEQSALPVDQLVLF